MRMSKFLVAKSQTVVAVQPIPATQTPEFKAWFRGSKVVNPDGTPKIVYHGSTHEFDRFDPSKGDKEGYYGAALYFSDGPQDVNLNYASPEGPDLKARIEKRVEGILEDLEEIWDDPGITPPIDLQGFDRDEPFPAWSSEGDYQKLRERAIAQAQKELMGKNQGSAYLTFLRMENPVVVKPSGGTHFEGGYFNRREEWKGGRDMTRLERAYRSAADQLGAWNSDDMWRGLMDGLDVIEDFTAWEFEKAVRDGVTDDGILDAGGPGPLIARTYQLMGFDGVILDAAAAFPSMKSTGRATHYMVWKPTQVKSALGNSGAFSSRSPRLVARLAALDPQVTTWVVDTVMDHLNHLYTNLGSTTSPGPMDLFVERSPYRLTTYAGEKLPLVVYVNLVDGIGSDFVQGGAMGVMPDGSVLITLHLSGGFSPDVYDPNRVRFAVEKKVRHELTHAADPRRGGTGYLHQPTTVGAGPLRLQDLTSWAAYVNDPAEIRAHLAEAVYEIETFLSGHPDAPKKLSAEQLGNLSSTWRQIGPHLTPDNRKVFLKAFARFKTGELPALGHATRASVIPRLAALAHDIEEEDGSRMVTFTLKGHDAPSFEIHASPSPDGGLRADIHVISAIGRWNHGLKPFHVAVPKENPLAMAQNLTNGIWDVMRQEYQVALDAATKRGDRQLGQKIVKEFQLRKQEILGDIVDAFVDVPRTKYFGRTAAINEVPETYGEDHVDTLGLPQSSGTHSAGPQHGAVNSPKSPNASRTAKLLRPKTASPQHYAAERLTDYLRSSHIHFTVSESNTHTIYVKVKTPRGDVKVRFADHPEPAYHDTWDKQGLSSDLSIDPVSGTTVQNAIDLISHKMTPWGMRTASLAKTASAWRTAAEKLGASSPALEQFYGIAAQAMQDGTKTFDQFVAKLRVGLGDRFPGFLKDMGGYAGLRPIWDSVLEQDEQDLVQSLEGFRISPRKPWAKENPNGKARAVPLEDPHGENKLQPDLESHAKAEDKFAHNVSLMETYPNFMALQYSSASAREKAEVMVEQMTDNLIWLFNHWKPEFRKRTKLWYVGGNRLIHRWAQRFQTDPHKIAAVVAALSPQQPWFQNITIAERTISAVVEHGDVKWDDKMTKHLLSRDWGQKQANDEGSQTPQNVLPELVGKSLNDLRREGGEDSLYKQAVWVRCWDETYNPNMLREVTPEGEFGDWSRTDEGRPAKVQWKSMAMTAKAIQALESPTAREISDIVGENHKVRSFYNNLVAPHSKGGDVTIDTHAVAAALLRPLSADSREVRHNFGGGPKGERGTASNAETGNVGTYGLYAEAYRRAAQKVGVQPRELQSITWEAVRGLFEVKFKGTKGVDTQNAILNTWEETSRGRLQPEQAREHISELVGGITTPSWARPGGANADLPRDSSYSRELSGPGSPGGGPGGLPSGAGGRTSSRASSWTGRVAKFLEPKAIIDGGVKHARTQRDQENRQASRCIESTGTWDDGYGEGSSRPQASLGAHPDTRGHRVVQGGCGLGGGCGITANHLSRGDRSVRRIASAGFKSSFASLDILFARAGFTERMDGPFGGVYFYSPTTDLWALVLPESGNSPGNPRAVVTWVKFKVSGPVHPTKRTDAPGWAKIGSRGVRKMESLTKFLRPKAVTAAEEYSDEDLRTDWLDILDEIQWDIPAALVERITKLNNLPYEWKLDKRFLVLNDKVWLLFDPEKKTLEYISDIRRWANEIDSSELEDIVPDVADLYNPMVGESLNQLRASKSGEVYHYTTPEALEKIKASGFLTGSYGNGLTNRWTHGVFTSCDPETNASGTYGDVMITIDLGAILQEHPDVPLSWEPEIDECLMRDYLEGALGREDGMGNNPDPSGGMSYDTLIIGAKIPLKYLSVEGESLAQPGRHVAAFEAAKPKTAASKAVLTQAHRLVKSLVAALAPQWYGMVLPGILTPELVELAKRPLKLGATEQELVTALQALKPVVDHGAMHGNTGYRRAYNEVIPALAGEPKTSKFLAPKVSPVLASLAQVAWA